MRLTTTQVSLLAAAIALAAPAITYRAGARLDRDRWVRERRAETYIDTLAVLGRLAAYVSEPANRPDPFDAIPGDRWRRFQAQIEAFASTQVVALRDAFLAAWERYRAAVHAVGAAGRPDAAADHRKEADAHAAEVRIIYADLISQVREELKQEKAPRWRRWRPSRRGRVTSGEGQAASARPASPPVADSPR